MSSKKPPSKYIIYHEYSEGCQGRNGSSCYDDKNKEKLELPSFSLCKKVIFFVFDFAL